MCVIALRWLSLPEPFVRCAYHVMTVSITGLYRHQDCAPTESLPSHIGSGLFMCPRLCWISLYLGDGSRLSICQIMECCFNIAYNSSQLWHLPPSLSSHSCAWIKVSSHFIGLCVSVVCAWVWSVRECGLVRVCGLCMICLCVCGPSRCRAVGRPHSWHRAVGRPRSRCCGPSLFAPMLPVVILWSQMIVFVRCCYFCINEWTNENVDQYPSVSECSKALYTWYRMLFW